MVNLDLNDIEGLKNFMHGLAISCPFPVPPSEPLAGVFLSVCQVIVLLS
jgi:hypothetical protein